MPRNWHYDARLIAVMGRKGRGKSFAQRHIVRSFPARWKIVYDHKGEFFRELPAHRCTTYEQCAVALDQTQSCCFDPRPMWNGNEKEEGFEDFCQKMMPVMKALDGPKLFTFDEVGLLAPDNWSKFKQHPLHEIISDGRSWEIDVCLAGQAPTDMTMRFRQQVTHWFVFNLGHPDAAESLREYGYTWEAITDLDKGEFIAYDHNTGEIFPKAKL